MGRDLKFFLLAVGIPALAIAFAGICLIRYEMKRADARQVERVRDWEERVRTWTQADAEAQAAENEWQRQVEEWQRQLDQLEQERQRQREEWQRQREERQKRRGPPQEGGPFRRFRMNLPPPPVPPAEKPSVRRFLGIFPSDLFSSEESVATERILWIGGCMLGLLFLSFGAGICLLLRSVRSAREEALKKTDFLSNISHEFKTPLTTICLCAELSQDEGLSPERRRRALASIRSDADRLKGLVLNALDFSRLEKHRREYRMEPCDLVALVAEAAGPLSERFAEHGLSLPSGEAFAQADASAFKQVVVILLDNAAKYAASGGPVEVSVAASAGRIVTTVSDRGPGLDRNGLRHAFDRFWRGDNATTAETGGSGLGLAIARALAEGMGGSLTAVPREEGGLVFTLTLQP